MSITLVLLSGGLDSSTALAAVSTDPGECRAIFFGYGQSAEQEEARAAAAISTFYDVPLTALRLIGPRFETGEIQGRNAFLVHAALLCSQPGPTTIVLGIHEGSGYVDCTPDFVNVMQRSLDLHSGGATTLSAPFVDHSKADICALARSLRVPISLTYSCERGGTPCGACMSCKDRDILNAIA